MRIVIDEWMNDIPSQFQGKKNIEILINAFARQLQEVQQMFADLYEKTDLDVATGQNLDYVGTIIPLTRKEAGELAGIGAKEPVISDERYRQFLRYKNLVNTNECTYYDLITGIELLWKYQNVHYIEDLDYPATIVFETVPSCLDQYDLLDFHTNLCIHSGGVGVILRKRFRGTYEIPVEIADMSLQIKSQVYLKGIYLYVDGSWDLDGEYDLSGERIRQAESYYGAHMAVIESILVQEANIGAFLKAEKNLWFLDGEYSLDGEKKLDADIQDYDFS